MKAVKSYSELNSTAQKIAARAITPRPRAEKNRRITPAFCSRGWISNNPNHSRSVKSFRSIIRPYQQFHLLKSSLPRFCPLPLKFQSCCDRKSPHIMRMQFAAFYSSESHRSCSVHNRPNESQNPKKSCERDALPTELYPRNSFERQSLACKFRISSEPCAHLFCPPDDFRRGPLLSRKVGAEACENALGDAVIRAHDSAGNVIETHEARYWSVRNAITRRNLNPKSSRAASK